MKGTLRHLANMFSTLGVGMFIGAFFDPKGINYFCTFVSIQVLIVSVAFSVLAEAGEKE